VVWVKGRNSTTKNNNNIHVVWVEELSRTLFSSFTHTTCMLLLFLVVLFSPFTHTTCMLLLFLLVLFSSFTHTTCML
jgi:hypothetical protein